MDIPVLPPLNAFKRKLLDQNGFLLVDVAPTEIEFEQIIGAAGIPRYHHPEYPLMIERVYNPGLEARFEAQAAEIAKKRGRSATIRWPMYHGTTESALNAIMASGFDPSKNVTSAFGRGTYFAHNLSLSAEYSQKDSYGYRIMFVCKVLEGVSIQGTAKEVLNTRDYDNFTGPGMLITPYPAGAMPVYVIRWFQEVPRTSSY